MMKKLLLIAVIFLVSGLVLFLSLFFYIGSKAHTDTKVPSDAILVLGGKAISGTDCYGPICKQIGFVPRPRYNPCVVARVDQAVSLYKNHYAPKILMSGGTDKEDNVNEAETMKTIAIQAGVNKQDILTETKSTSTYENFLFSKNILGKNNIHSIIIVTDPYHNARAELVARKLDYHYTLSPAAKSPCSDQDQNTRNYSHEALDIIGYALLNRI